jgi:hypothetical protein
MAGAESHCAILDYCDCARVDVDRNIEAEVVGGIHLEILDGNQAV